MTQEERAEGRTMTEQTEREKLVPLFVSEKFYRDAQRAGWDMNRFRIARPLPLAASPYAPPLIKAGV